MDGVGDRSASQVLFKTHGVGLWALWRKEPEDPQHARILGAAGYRFFHEPPEVQLVVALFPRARGRGLATEAC